MSPTSPTEAPANELVAAAEQVFDAAAYAAKTVAKRPVTTAIVVASRLLEGIFRAVSDGWSTLTK